MAKATDVVYKYYEGEFAVKHRKDGFKASFAGVLNSYIFIDTIISIKIGYVKYLIFIPIYEKRYIEFKKIYRQRFNRNIFSLRCKAR